MQERNVQNRLADYITKGMSSDGSGMIQISVGCLSSAHAILV